MKGSELKDTNSQISIGRQHSNTDIQVVYESASLPASKLSKGITLTTFPGQNFNGTHRIDENETQFNKSQLVINPGPSAYLPYGFQTPSQRDISFLHRQEEDSIAASVMESLQLTFLKGETPKHPLLLEALKKSKQLKIMRPVCQQASRIGNLNPKKKIYLGIEPDGTVRKD